VTTYERKLSADFEYALAEGGMHFDAKSSVHRTLREITSRLKQLDIPYALVGAMGI
jgi:hypothetical protein